MARIPLYYTFGNHMHWVDMQWLWGYHVLPGSIRDMIHLCREAGVKGAVNFDGVGYEKLAAEDPEALAELRAAVREGIVEPVGCSYGQPYGLFHGGESNVRQLIFGARAVRRLLGVWPKTFWEEEFYFFPQLPQMLVGCGFTGASLFFQWTWHTPEVPKEDCPAIKWEGLDGTMILAATRNRLNMHQWPEDMDTVLSGIGASPMVSSGVSPELIQQWLELMPSPDWMCRSEVILPKLKELLADERFEVRPVTLGEYLSVIGDATVPFRNYAMDQAWHGMTLGKNGDEAIRQSHSIERQLRTAETLYALAGIFGRPYVNWDVYPVWELQDGWANLLAAQHHDNHECEGLCGYVADELYLTAERRATLDRVLDHLAIRCGYHEGDVLAVNPYGWTIRGTVHNDSGKEISIELPPMSYRLVRESELSEPTTAFTFTMDRLVFERGLFRCQFDPEHLRFTLSNDGGQTERSLMLTPSYQRAGVVVKLDQISQAVAETIHLGDGEIAFWASIPKDKDVLELTVSCEASDFDPGIMGGQKAHLVPSFPIAQVMADTPFGVGPITPGGPFYRKYPEGDWMTSPQWFEQVDDVFTALSCVDLLDADGDGICITHDGSEQWFWQGDRVSNLIAAIDPWDEDRAISHGRVTYQIYLHAGQSNADRYRAGQCLFGYREWERASMLLGHTISDRSHFGGRLPSMEPDLPQSFDLLRCSPDHVVVAALYREAEDFAGKHVENYAGEGMGYPYILRLVELNGEDANVELTIVGPVAKAFKTNLLGQIELDVEVLTPPPGPLPASGEGEFAYDVLRFPMRPYEIATLYLDIQPGRKQTRDLDSKREIWATVHRVEP